MTTDRPPNEGQLSTDLPGLTHHFTGHDSSGNAIIHSTHPAHWTPISTQDMAYNVVYTTSQFPPSMTADTDLTAHNHLIQSHNLGLVNPTGTVARIVDFAPSNEPVMHRTQSLDYGIVLEGEVEMILDEGITRVMRRGDVAVQRGTNHGWKNVGSGWARMFFVLQAAEKVEVGGKVLGEDLSTAGDAGTGH